MESFFIHTLIGNNYNSFIGTSNENQGEVETTTENEANSSPEKPAPPEIMKSKCPACSKEFSSIWVLKAHSEEVHKDVVPQDFLEKYIEELKSNLDKSESASSEVSEASPIKKCLNPLQAPSTLLTPEKSSEDGDCGPRSNIFPETSTPKSRSSTPAMQPNRHSTPGPMSAGSRDLNSEPGGPDTGKAEKN